MLVILLPLFLLNSFLSPLVILPLGFIVCLFLTFLYKEKFIVILAVALYISFTSEFYGQYRLVFNFIATISLLIIFLRKYGFRFNKYIAVPKEVWIFLGILFLTLIISTIFSYNFLIGGIATVRTLIFFGICYLLFSVLHNKQFIYVFIYSLLLVVLIVGTRMLLDLYNLGFQDYFRRIVVSEVFELQGSTGYTGHTIFFISVSLITAMLFLEKFKSLKKRILLSVLLVINVAIIIIANSRGGIIAAIISLGFFFFTIRKSLFIKTFVFIAFFVLFLFIVIPETMNTYLRWNTVGDREVYWEMGLEVIKDYPIFGLGPDLFDKHFYNYAPSNILGLFKTDVGSMAKPHPHNFFIYFTAENGILGLITSITFFITFFSIAFKTISLTKETNNDFFVLSVIITGIGIALFFRSFIEIAGYLTYGYITRDLPFWLLFGILISIYQRMKQTEYE